jgi:hypothetical protein
MLQSCFSRGKWLVTELLMLVRDHEQSTEKLPRFSEISTSTIPKKLFVLYPPAENHCILTMLQLL